MKKALCLLTTVFLLLSIIAFSVSAEEQEKPYYGYSKTSFFITEKPDSYASSVHLVSSGREVVIFGEHEDWYKVLYADPVQGNFFGYAEKRYIDIIYTAKTDSQNVVIFASPDPFSDSLGTIAKYSEFACLGEEVETGWRYVKAIDEITGYEMEGYISDGAIVVDGKLKYEGTLSFPEHLEIEESEEESAEDDLEDYRARRESQKIQFFAWVSLIVVGIYAIITIFRIKNA